MSGAAEFLIEARVDEREREAVKAAARQLARALRDADAQGQWRVGVRFASPGQASPQQPAPSAVVLSMLPEFGRDGEALEATKQRWRLDIDRLVSQGRPVYLMNVFRHVRERRPDGRPSPVLERIRALGRMAIDLSRDAGVGLADVDSACADAGAALLGCDWTLGSSAAAEVAGAALVSCMLSTGLDAVMDAGIQEGAKAAHARLHGRSLETARRIIARDMNRTETPHAARTDPAGHQ